MRTELEKIKYIEDYLTGKLPADEVKSFKAEINNNPTLAQEVELQQQIIKRAQRAALKEKFDAIHQANFSTSAKKWWQQNIWLNSILAIFATASIIAVLMLSGDSEKEAIKLTEGATSPTVDQPTKTPAYTTKPEYDMECIDSTKSDGEALLENISTLQPKEIEEFNDETEESIVDELAEQYVVKDQIDSLQEDSTPLITFENFKPVFDTLNYVPAEGLVHNYERSGTIINLPVNLILGKENSTEPIKLLYREYRNQAEIAFSGIPMDYKANGQHFEFESAGMFDFYPLDSSLKMNPNCQNEVEIKFALKTANIDLDFYQLENNKWVKKAEIIEKQPDTLPKLECDPEKICDFEVKARYAKRLADKGRKKPFFKRLFPKREDDRLKFGRISKTRTFRIDIKFNNGSIKESFNLWIPYQESQIYLEDPLKSFAVKKQVINRLNLQCTSCSKKAQWANPEKVKRLMSKPLNSDSLYRELKKEREANLIREREKKVDFAKELLDDETNLVSYQVSKERKKGSWAAFVYLKVISFGTANCDAVRPYTAPKPKLIKTDFIVEFGKEIENVKRVSLVPLNFNSATSFDYDDIAVYNSAWRVLLFFTDNGLYYLNNDGLRDVVINNTKRIAIQKLPETVNSQKGLALFLEEEYKKLLY